MDDRFALSFRVVGLVWTRIMVLGSDWARLTADGLPRNCVAMFAVPGVSAVAWTNDEP